ncbi:PH domain-containing protein [Shewanella sp. GutCb]|uniref:PH domain-containing protein n=1 Tax=Shewanella sp. GutCb TaxID=2058315 RepID=UPI002155C40F|nr:PH domain-containing protein [Shewanella sp. GutCb]
MENSHLATDTTSSAAKADTATADLQNQQMSALNQQHSDYQQHNTVSQAQWQGFDQIPLQPIDKRHYTQVLYESLFVAVIIFSGATIGIILPAALSVVMAVVVLTTLLLLLSSITYLRYLQAKKLSYAVCEHEFIMEQGLWWQQRTSLPYSRLQHVSLSQGPLERHFNLFTLKCFSAGSGSAEIELPGIEQHTAEHLRQHLLAQAAKVHLADPQTSDVETITAGSEATDVENVSVEADAVTADAISPEATAKQAEAHHDQ